MNPEDVPWEVLREYNFIVKHHKYLSTTDKNSILVLAEQLDCHALATFIREKQSAGFVALLEKGSNARLLSHCSLSGSNKDRLVVTFQLHAFSRPYQQWI